MGSAGVFVGSMGVENVTIITPHCPFPKTDGRWAADSCCNPNLRFSQCCVPRPVVVARPVIATFKPAVDTTCKTPALVRGLMRHVQRFYINDRDSFCENAFLKASQDIANMVNSFGQCLNDFLNAAKPCANNGDCPNNNCDSDTFTCAPNGYDASPTPLATCIVNNIPPFAIRAFQLFNNVTSTQIAVADLTALIQKVLFKPYCVSNLNLPVPGLNTQAACENDKICTDNTPTCADSNSFCGFGCQPNKQCQMNIGAVNPFVNNQATCTSFGLCIGKDPVTGNDFSTYANSTVCATQSFCTVKSCYPNCDATKCANTGLCLGFPAPPGTGVCVLPFPSMQDGSAPQCPTGQNIGIGCFANLISTQGACTIAKGNWYDYPTNQAQCESGFTICREANGVMSLKNGAECAKCNGRLNKPFKWIQGVWRQRVFKQITSWTPRAPVSKNKWVSGIDFNGFGQFVQNAVRSLSYPLLKSRVMCSVEPLYQATRLFACDCGAEATTGCFDKFKAGASVAFPSAIGNFRAFAGANATYQFADVSVDVPTGSVSASADNTNVVVTKSDVVISATSTRSTKQASTTINVVDNSGTVVGQVVGNGVAVSVAFPSGVTLCVPMSEQVTVSSKYTKAGFVISNSAGNYMLTSVTITSTSNGQLCGTVTDTQTYFPAYVDPSAQPQQPKSSASTASVFSAVVIAVLAILALLF